jgi:hypothetical protein
MVEEECQLAVFGTGGWLQFQLLRQSVAAAVDAAFLLKIGAVSHF